MNIRQECLCYCIDHLETRGLGFVFNQEIFNRVFELHNSPGANYYRIALTAADDMIYSFQPETVNHD